MKFDNALRAFGASCLLVWIVGCSSMSSPTLKSLAIGVQAAKPEETRAAWAPLVEDMGKKLSIPTTLVTASQGDIVNALRDGKVDVVWLSSSAAIDAITNADAEAFALYYNVNGTNGYKGIVVTRSDSGITTLEQALEKGKYSYASGPKTSTSGYVLPQHFLFNKRKTTPEDTFKSVVYGNHFDNLAALWDKKVDVAVNNSTDTTVFQEARQPAAKGNLRVLWESPLVPNDVLMFRKDTPEATKTALRQFFLTTYGQTEQEKELYKKASGIRNFLPTDNKLLEPVSEFKFATERVGVAANAKLSQDEKDAQFKALDQRIDKFKKSLALMR